VAHSEATRAKAANYQAGAASVDAFLARARAQMWVERMAAYRGWCPEPELESREPCPPLWRWRKRKRWMLAARIAELELELGLTVR
jgi:hypothetical protein